MYEAFYSLKERPFAVLPDPGFLYLSKKHQAALTLLEYGLINQVGFSVISGETGAGKTTVLHSLLERIGDDVSVGMISNARQSFGGLLDWVLSAFDLHKPGLTHIEMRQVFLDYLNEQQANNHTVLLMVDEAQNMAAEELEELRMLSNVNSEKGQLMQIVLAGQPVLREILAQPELKQFAERIAVDYQIDPLGLKETFAYIQHRLVTAGATKDVFTPAACQRIHRYSGGTPGLINLFCETALVHGFADQQKLIDVNLIDEMAQERLKDSVVTVVNPDVDHEENEGLSEDLLRDFPWIRPERGTEDLRAVTVPSSTEEKKVLEEFVPTVAPVSIDKGERGTEDLQAGTEPSSAEEKKVLEELVPTVTPVSTDKDESVLSVGERDSPEEDFSADTKLKKSSESIKPVEDIKQDEDKGEAPSVTVEPADVEQDIASGQHAAVPGSPVGDGGGATMGPVKKIGMLAAVLVIVLAGLIVVFDDGELAKIKAVVFDYVDLAKTKAKAVVFDYVNLTEIKAEALEMQKQRQQEESKLMQLQMEAQVLKKERDAAIIARVEQERLAKQEAERIAEEKAVAAIKEAEEKAAAIDAEKKAAAAALVAEQTRIEEDRKRAAAAKDREFKAMRAEAEAKAEARYAKLEAARLTEERIVMQRRLDEEIRLKQLEEARRLELERIELERLKLQSTAIKKAEPVVEKKSVECSGPTARFKSGCR